ncbi:carboxypeptidase-like regulatory domain-containing protein [Burkholderia arboris]|uniref:carboxypeptidase-like regulatory domain-containing protein n=1 Tax=Burkholderia arboris TaxID=488730 RepID=UPI0021CCBAC2|nr:carboxypeptidase-like regulatory domain-containing protein [Burkholderia arboris]
MRKRRNPGISHFALCASMSVLLAACGGGDGSSTSSSTGSPTSTAAASSMSGTVAIGSALVGATINVTDANGKTVTTTSGANGTYTVPIGGLTAPFLLTANDPSGASRTLYSVVATTATANGAPVTVNITPLTTAIAALLTASGNPLDLALTSGASSITSSAVGTAVTKLDVAIASILSANGLSAAFDPIGTAFATDKTGADAVIDSIKVTPSTTDTGMQITSLADPNTAIQLNAGTPVTTSLKNAPQAANYLAGLVAQLSQCMTDVQGGAANSQACSVAIDAKYLNQGFANMGQRHTLFVKGTKLTDVKTVAFIPAGTLPGISNPAALVYFLVTDPNGTSNFMSDVVQQLPNGNWDVIGNQEQYNLYIAAFQGKLNFVDSTDQPGSRYESGLNIQIPYAVATNGVRTTVGSARVQGAGLPSTGLYLLNSQGAGLTIPTTALTGPWQGCGTCSQSNGTTTQYKMDWVSQSGGAIASPGSADYAPQPLNLSTVRQFAPYTVTLYDMAGNPIGTPQTVLNIAPIVSAASAASAPWQTLGSDVIANFLSPTGSQATAPLSTLNLDWQAPATSGTYPNVWSAIGVVQSATQFAPQEAYSIFDWDTPTLNGSTYSESFPGSTHFPYVTQEGLAAESAREVQLGWQVDGDYYINRWVYRH